MRPNALNDASSARPVEHRPPRAEPLVANGTLQNIASDAPALGGIAPNELPSPPSVSDDAKASGMGPGEESGLLPNG